MVSIFQYNGFSPGNRLKQISLSLVRVEQSVEYSPRASAGGRRRGAAAAAGAPAAALPRFLEHTKVGTGDPTY